ncbi:hypothetical protein Acr_00g0039930 [Actinidia rufa]|uniref:Uncharacterized protein n=1 Tax=Actinidia rufa TaxID=165716 RepID=A0A7J0DJG7_9ERIC|nr:hypothetical protein Acr_00g0039930 [Actinidia rufa]
MTKTMFTLQILHGGKFVQGEQVTYVNVKLTSDAEIVHMFDAHDESDMYLIEVFVHTPDLVDACGTSDSEWHDDVQIDSDKEAFSGMEESSTDDEEELGDKEVGDNVGDNEECDSDCSDDPHCLNESLSDDESKPKFPEFREKDMKNPQLQLE